MFEIFCHLLYLVYQCVDYICIMCANFVGPCFRRMMFRRSLDHLTAVFRSTSFDLEERHTRATSSVETYLRVP